MAGLIVNVIDSVTMAFLGAFQVLNQLGASTTQTKKVIIKAVTKHWRGFKYKIISNCFPKKLVITTINQEGNVNCLFIVEVQILFQGKANESIIQQPFLNKNLTQNWPQIL